MNSQVMFDGACLPEEVPSNNVVLTDAKVRAESYHSSLCQSIADVKHSLLECCCYLYRMQDEKLYHLLGYEDFKDYAENCLHFSYSQAVRFSCVGRLVSSKVAPVQLDSDFINDLGISKLYELSKLQADEIKTLFDAYDVSDLTRKELKDSISTVKAYKKASYDSGYNKSISEFIQFLHDSVDQEQAAAETQQGREEPKSSLDARSQRMISLLMALDAALHNVEMYYMDHENYFSGDRLLCVIPSISRVERHVSFDLHLLNGGDPNE